MPRSFIIRNERISFQPDLLVVFERLPMELHGLGEVGHKITGAMVAGIEMELMLDLLSTELLIQRLSSLFETEFVFVAAVEVDGEFCDG
jgi:hypothetical protein